MIQELARYFFKPAVQFSTTVACAIHFAHAACANGREYFVGAETVTYRAGQWVTFYSAQLPRNACQGVMRNVLTVPRPVSRVIRKVRLPDASRTSGSRNFPGGTHAR
jgi:hypothetical protein